MLATILQTKRESLEKLTVPRGKRTRPVHDMPASLRQAPLICEVKRRSPSHGAFPDTDPPARAALYRDAGAGAISVLTDTPFFGGSFDDLAAVADTVDIPILCKDFILSQVQVDMAYRMGADAILLIAAALTDTDLSGLTERAETVGLSILYEIHDEAELDRVLRLRPRMIGINARNLKTMDVRLETVRDLLPRIPAGITAVAESGIRTADDVRSLQACGAGAFLVGTALMETADPGSVIRTLHGAMEK